MQTIFPDGRRLTVSGNPHGFAGSWLSTMTVQGPGRHLLLRAGARGGVEEFPVLMGERVTVREASVRGTRVVSVEHPEHGGGTTLVWQAGHHEVSTFVHGTDVPLEVLPNLLAPLEIVDSPDGVVVRARRGTGVQVRYDDTLNTIPDVGAVTVKPLEAATTQVPSSGGRTMRGGQLWRDDRLADDGSVAERTLVLANESTASFVVPFDPEDEAVVPLIRSISFSLS